MANGFKVSSMQTLSNRRVSNSLNALNAGTPRPHLELTVIDDWT